MKEQRAFLFLALSIGAANTIVFIFMSIKKAVYVYEPNPLILYAEVSLAVIFTIWTAIRLIRLELKK